MSLARQIVIETARRGSSPVLVAEGLRIGGQMLALMARNMALHLVQRGIGRGALVAMRSDDIVVSLCSVLAAGLLGCRWRLEDGESVGEEAADLVLDTAPQGALLPGAVLVDESWAVQPMPETEGMFPESLDGDDWLILDGAALSDGDLRARFRAEAAVFDRPGTAVVGLGAADAPEQLLLALATLYHGGVLVESARAADWQAEGVVLVAGRPEAVMACLGTWPFGLTIRALRLWGEDAEELPVGRFERVTVERLAVGANRHPESGPPPDQAFDLLDQLLREVEGVTDAISFLVPKAGKPDRLTAFLQLATGADVPRVTSEARIAALRLGGREAVPQRFLIADTLPRLANGRPDRDACRALVVSARLKRQRKSASEPGESASQG